MTGWLGFNTAVSGLLSSQKSLYTTNHNISNANTKGYTRQQALQRSTSPLGLPGVGMIGTGTEIYEIERIRDSYVDYKYWGENSPLGEWEVKRETLVELENLFNEPSDSSFRKNLDDFFGALESLSKNPSDYASRSLVKETASGLTEHLNETAGRLYNVQKELNFAVSTKIKQVNDIGEQISNINEQIYKLELDGVKANDLRDKREVLVDELSKIVNVQVNESSDGKFRVSIGGISLVEHVDMHKLKSPPDTVNNPYNPKEKLALIQWELGDQDVIMESGELKALVDLRDENGQGGTYRGVPFYIERLNQFAQKLATRMNDVHQTGFGQNGSNNMLMFTVNDKLSSDFDPAVDEVRADNISLSGDILNNLDNIATASAEDGVENNEVILALIALREDKSFFDDPVNPPQGTPDDFVKSILSSLAVDSQQADRMNNNQTVIMDNIKIKRESVSGVSIDEEMSNMVKFQHSYNAAARMITTMDAIFDVTINRLGLVGR